MTAFAQDITPADTLFDEGVRADSAMITRRNTARNFNYLDHVLGGRYMASGDEFTKRWDDHLFIEVGAGMEQLVAPPEHYGFTPITYAKIALGKQFSPKHSLRLSTQGGYAYQKKKEFFLLQLGGKLDHIFDLSSYFSGYDPTRRLSVSTIVGIGATYSRFALNDQAFEKNSGIAFEGHLGLQFKVFTGPQGYINIEPYAGLSSDAVDISGKKNWRGYDPFYGANLTYVYYLRNNLSPEARREYIANRILKDELTADTTLYSWRKPLFVEMANSLHITNIPELSSGQTLGMGYSLAVGGWLSPAIALRGTVTSENVVFMHTANEAHGTTDAQTGSYIGGRADALFNPFGLVRHYNWDSRFGIYGVVGLQAGKLWKRNYSENEISTYYQGYSAGLHLWAKLADGLQFFIEPRFEHNEYHKPKQDRPANWHYTDDLWGVNLGITVSTRTRKYTDWRLWEERDQSQFMNKFVIGVGAGLNYLQKKVQYAETNFKLGLNTSAYLEYHFNAHHAVRASLDGIYHPLKFYNNGGLGSKKYANALISLDYMLNVTNILNSQDPDLRTFEAFAFAGPSVISGVSRNSITTPQFTVNVGAKLLYHFDRHIGIHITPTFYYIPDWVKRNVFKEQVLSRTIFFETLNAGVQYTF